MLKEEEGLEPVVFHSPREALEVANGYREWHPEIDFEVREYQGRNRFLYEFVPEGMWRLGGSK